MMTDLPSIPPVALPEPAATTVPANPPATATPAPTSPALSPAPSPTAAGSSPPSGGSTPGIPYQLHYDVETSASS